MCAGHRYPYAGKPQQPGEWGGVPSEHRKINCMTCFNNCSVYSQVMDKEYILELDMEMEVQHFKRINY